MFDAVCSVLTKRGYLDSAGVTEPGRMLARVWTEADLLVAECIRRDVWTGLSPAELAAAALGAGADAYILVMTHDHNLDYALISSALAGGSFGYLGLIGSDTKKARFLGRLRKDGFGDGTAARVTCPIGLPRLKNKAPEVIAVSVASDLLMRLEAARRERVKDLKLASV